MGNPIETGDIAAELEKIGKCAGVFPQRTLDACNQGASLLRQLRPIVLSEMRDQEIVSQLRDMIAKQGDG